MIMMIIALVIVFGGIFGYDLFRSMMIKHFITAHKAPPETISAEPAKLENWSPSISAVGTLTAINGVSITPQIAGQATQINFQDGQLVRKGQVLVNEDTRQYQDDLQGYEATLALAKINFWRQSKLYKDKFATGEARDEALANLKQAQANVDKTKVIIDQMTIKAPFDGKIGITKIHLGQFLTPGQTAIANLEQLNPLEVQFYVPEQNYGKIAVGQSVFITVDSCSGQTFTGQITAIDSGINTNTRNLLVEALINNPDLKLYPGMFANVQVILPTENNVITVPETAVTYNLYGSSVFVLTPSSNQATAGKQKDKGTTPIQTLYQAHRQFVQEGETRENKVQIISGLKAGDLVVTSGQLKVDDGSLVYVNNSVDIDKTNYSETD